MSGESDELKSGGVDEGWGDDDGLTREKHETESNTEEQSEPDANESVTKDAETSPASATPPANWDWNRLVSHPAYADHARTKASEVEQPNFDLIPVTETQLQPFKDSKERMHSDTEQANARVRPEVKQALKETMRDAEDFFDEDPPKTHVYEALFIAGMLNMDLTMGILSTYGYGLNEHEE